MSLKNSESRFPPVPRSPGLPVKRADGEKGRQGDGERETRTGVAVLALQGDFEAHRKKLAAMGIESFEARRPGEIEDAAGLVIPGRGVHDALEVLRVGPLGGGDRPVGRERAARARDVCRRDRAGARSDESRGEGNGPD